MTITLSPMPPDRHESVRTLLVSHAADIAPARPHPRRRVAVAATVMTAAVAAVGVTLLVAERRAPMPTGSWSAVPVNALGPITLDQDDRDAWGTQCQDITGGAPVFGGLADDPDLATTRRVLVDIRGGYTFCVDVSLGDGTEANPLVAFAGVRGPEAPDSTADSEGVRWGGQGSWGSSDDSAVLTPPADDQLIMFGEPNHVRPNGETDHAKVAYGPAGPAVRGVELVLTDGTRVTATVANGLWGAWWPSWESTAGVAELIITTPSGTRAVNPASVEYRSSTEAY